MLTCYKLYFDGSVTKTKASEGWALYGASEVTHDTPEEWIQIAIASFSMPPSSAITACEL